MAPSGCYSVFKNVTQQIPSGYDMDFLNRKMQCLKMFMDPRRRPEVRTQTSQLLRSCLRSQQRSALFTHLKPMGTSSGSFRGIQFSSVQFIRSVVSDSLRPHESQHAVPPCPPVHHQLPEFTQTQVHLISDAIQPSHPLSSPSPPAPNLSQHQSLFQ